jgi:pimeloyl-ACP methyl ester carboxylesterase
VSRGLSVIDRGRGPAVLLVHGQPGLGADWDAVVGELVGDHRLVVPDRPGYGASGMGPVTMAANADILADMVVERGAAPVTVVGHSYGGGVAVLMAARRPDVVSGLVLVASVGRADSITAADHVLAAPWAGEALSAASLFVLGRLMPRVRGLAARVPGHRLAWLEASLPDDRYFEVSSKFGGQIWRSFVFEQRTLLREITDVEEALPGLRVPTVVVAGAWDVVVPLSVATSVVAAVDGARLMTVARTGHFVPRDAPQVVAAAVRQVESIAAVDGARAAGERAAGDRAAGDHAAGDHAAGDRAAGDHAAGDHAARDHAARDRAIDDRAIDDRAIEDRVVEDRVVEDRVVGNGGPSATDLGPRRRGPYGV